jgi:hypothetical protein
MLRNSRGGLVNHACMLRESRGGLAGASPAKGAEQGLKDLSVGSIDCVPGTPFDSSEFPEV